MNPKFSIGERVSIFCTDLPHLHGTEHTITGIKWVTFTAHNNVTLLCYELGFSYEWQGYKNYTYWQESTLYKKHQPSEFSFSSLMDNLKLPQKA